MTIFIKTYIFGKLREGKGREEEGREGREGKKRSVGSEKTLERIRQGQNIVWSFVGRFLDKVFVFCYF